MGGSTLDEHLCKEAYKSSNPSTICYKIVLQTFKVTKNNENEAGDGQFSYVVLKCSVFGILQIVNK